MVYTMRITANTQSLQKLFVARNIKDSFYQHVLLGTHTLSKNREWSKKGLTECNLFDATIQLFLDRHNHNTGWCALTAVVAAVAVAVVVEGSCQTTFWDLLWRFETLKVLANVILTSLTVSKENQNSLIPHCEKVQFYECCKNVRATKPGSWLDVLAVQHLLRW